MRILIKRYKTFKCTKQNLGVEECNNWAKIFDRGVQQHIRASRRKDREDEDKSFEIIHSEEELKKKRMKKARVQIG